MPKWTEAPKKADVVLWICGAVALASLAACIILPIWVYMTGGEDYERNFAWFKRILIWPTLIYFIAGTIWAVKRDKAE
jgi:hypothetical protein